MQSNMHVFSVEGEPGIALVPADDPDAAKQWLRRLEEMMENSGSDPVSKPSRPVLRLVEADDDFPDAG